MGYIETQNYRKRRNLVQCTIARDLVDRLKLLKNDCEVRNLNDAVKFVLNFYDKNNKVEEVKEV
jgi:hypothetical protein